MPENNANPIAKDDSLKSINKAIKAITGSAVKLNNLIHETALACAAHAKTYGDTDQCARLVDAMPMSHRRSLLINWFDSFTPVGIQKNAKTGQMKAHLKGKTEERDKMWNIDAGKATPFYAMPDVEREPDVPTYESVHNNIVAFVKRMEKKADEIANDDQKQAALEEIAALKQAVGAKKVVGEIDF